MAGIKCVEDTNIQGIFYSQLWFGHDQLGAFTQIQSALNVFGLLQIKLVTNGKTVPDALVTANIPSPGALVAASQTRQALAITGSVLNFLANGFDPLASVTIGSISAIFTTIGTDDYEQNNIQNMEQYLQNLPSEIQSYVQGLVGNAIATTSNQQTENNIYSLEQQYRDFLQTKLTVLNKSAGLSEALISLKSIILNYQALVQDNMFCPFGSGLATSQASTADISNTIDSTNVDEYVLCSQMMLQLIPGAILDIYTYTMQYILLTQYLQTMTSDYGVATCSQLMNDLGISSFVTYVGNGLASLQSFLITKRTKDISIQTSQVTCNGWGNHGVIGSFCPRVIPLVVDYSCPGTWSEDYYQNCQFDQQTVADPGYLTTMFLLQTITGVDMSGYVTDAMNTFLNEVKFDMKTVSYHYDSTSQLLSNFESSVNKYCESQSTTGYSLVTSNSPQSLDLGTTLSPLQYLF